MRQRWLLLTVAALCPLLRLVGSCPVTGCFGCGSNHVTCSGAMPRLTSFPSISSADQQMVEVLDLSGNMLSAISASDLQNYIALEELDISSNTLTSLEPGTFSMAFQLEELRLQNNNLREIPDNLFVNTSLLTELNLGSNMVENISEALFTGLSASVEIYLDNNQIQTISEGVLPIHFTTLKLTNNPLHCDCGLHWLPDFIDALLPTATFDAGTCESPNNLAGMDVSNLTESQFVCECSPTCLNGSCNTSVGQCECNAGFVGDDCSFRCPAGFYGQNCEEVCQCQNGAECDFITGGCTCTIGWSGEYCNSSSCQDGIMNHGETDVDCGGNLCPSCGIGDACAFNTDCGNRTVCLGKYTHPSGLSYPFRTNDNLHCVNESVPGEALLQRFKDAFLGREDALTTTDSQANLSELQTSVQEEVEAQLEIEEPLESVEISDLEREPGNPLYHTCLQWSDTSSEAAVDDDIQRMVDNIHDGKLKGTLIISREKRKALLNF